jgi:S1-C subfamily serine protease
VVYVANAKAPRGDFFFETGEPPQGEGSGFVWDERGHIVTNYHVVIGGERFSVSLSDGTTYDATLVGVAPRKDLAVLRIDAGHPLPPVELGDSHKLRVGQKVLAIGNPYGLDSSLTTGVISALGREIESIAGTRIEDVIQTDASINPGNSGGPLLNINGELIGINTAVNAAAENMGFAIPVARVRQVLTDNLLSLAKSRTWLGFEADPSDFVVRTITSGSPAQDAGLMPGDRLIALGDKPLRNEEDYRLARLTVQPGQEVPLRVLRGNTEVDLRLAAWNRVDGLIYERLGVTFERRFFGNNYAPFLLVSRVQPDGPADRIGLIEGDLLAAVRPPLWPRGRLIQNVEALAYLINARRPGDELEVEILRDDDKDGRYARENELYSGRLELR